MHPPLSGITVVSIEQAVAAPFATRQLADLGARVIKIERPDGGDFARAYDTTVNGLSSYFVWLNRSKESLDARSQVAGGDAVLDRLLAARGRVRAEPRATAPPIASASRRRDAARAISAADHLQRISGYGSSGPLARRKAYDLLVQSETGLLSHHRHG